MTTEQYQRVNRKFEKQWYPRVYRSLKSKVSSLIDILKERGFAAATAFSDDLVNVQLTATVKRLYRDVGLYHARQRERELRVGKSFGSFETKRLGKSEEWIQFINDFLNRYLIEKITFGVTRTTRDQLLSVLQQAVEEGWGIDETVKRLESLPFLKYQAARIVRTEINRASNTGIRAQGETFEYELQKEWISARDNRTRGADGEDHADHLRMNGQTVDFEDFFVDPRNGHRLSQPGDPEAKGEDTINCRCQMGTKAKRDARGRMIPKK
jgi:hypothetical protein